MKKGIIALLLIVMSIPGKGQEIKTGFTIGGTLSSWIGDVDIFATELGRQMNDQDDFSGFSFTSEPRIGFNMGFFAEIPLYKSFSLLPELSYIQNGAVFSGSGTLTLYGDSYTVDSDMTWQLDYVNLIIPFKFSPGKARIRPYIYAGPGIGYLAYRRLKVKVTLDEESESDSSEAEGFNKFTGYLNLGGGLDFSESVRLDFRYSVSMGELIPEETSGIRDFSVKSKVLSLSLAATF